MSACASAFPSERCLEPIIEPPDPAALGLEIETLVRTRTLLEHGPYRVVAGKGRHLPNCLHEIGRLREITFRAVGEGTGQAIDLDRFDEHYEHVMVYDQAAGQIVGAYRAGATDEILPRQGLDGLYTATLFDLDPALFDRWGPALELGRSFIRPEHQRVRNVLPLLWRGIARLVARQPRYRRLFGPVSISQSYGRFAQQLIAATLSRIHGALDLAPLARPRIPLTPLRPGQTDQLPQTVRELTDRLTAEAGTRTDLPVLLKHYLKLGGRLLSFNVDPAFSNVVDGLIVVDLLHTKPRLRRLYFGEANDSAFIDYHDQQPNSDSAPDLPTESQVRTITGTPPEVGRSAGG